MEEREPLLPPSKDVEQQGKNISFIKPSEIEEYVEYSLSMAGENRLTFPADTVMDRANLIRACTAEFCAMLLFVYFGCGSVVATGEFLVNSNNEPSPDQKSVARILPIATAFGIMITILIFNIGHISGGHMNPAVTWALMLMQKISPLRGVYYVVSQFAGATLGALFLWGSISQISYLPEYGALIGNPPFHLGANELSPHLNVGNGFFLEMMGTSLLVTTVLFSAVDQRGYAASNLLPLPIGFSVWIAHIALIPWTGCGINPARTFGVALVNSMAGTNTWGTTWWIYYIGPLVGSTLSVLATRFMWRGVNPPPRAAL